MLFWYDILTLNKLHSNNKSHCLSKQIRHALLGYFRGYTTLTNDVIISFVAILSGCLLTETIALHVLFILSSPLGQSMVNIYLLGNVLFN